MELFSFTTEPEVCPYLHDRSSRNRVRYVDRLSEKEYAELLSTGWRRFGAVLFRPTCGACRECVPIRIPVDRFRLSKSQRRVWRRNDDLRVDVGRPRVDAERLRLHREFHAERSATRGWPVQRIEPDEYAASFVKNAAKTLEFRYRLGGRLVGIAYVGESADSFNSIYAFFDPAEFRRGLGTYDVLREVSEARERGKRWVYLGFLVSGCGSMAYKAAFRPHELLVDGRWRVPPGVADDGTTGPPPD